MNAHTALLELLWNIQAFLVLFICTWNYHDCWRDIRKMTDDGRNGLLALSSEDARQAELFRAFVAACLISAGLIVASLPGMTQRGITPVAWVQCLFVLALTGVGLSSIRSRINRKRALNYEEPIVPYVGPDRRTPPVGTHDLGGSEP